MRGLILGAALALALAAPAFAQNKQSLADIRKELDQLAAQLQDLRGELVSSGAKGLQAAGGASALTRMNTMEAELSRLTSATEQMQNKIDRVTRDASTQLGDLEFRVCDLEQGCDPSTVPQDPLGGAKGGASLGGSGAKASSLTAPAPDTTAAPASGGDMTVNEQADFDRAKGVLGQGDFQGAADQFATFAQTYPGGPLTPDAMYLRGEALSKAGDTTGAATAWLDAFKTDPTGKRAPDNLLQLGKVLGQLGQTHEACITLNEVSSRFPSSSAAGQAAASRSSLGCQ